MSDEGFWNRAGRTVLNIVTLGATGKVETVRQAAEQADGRYRASLDRIENLQGRTMSLASSRGEANRDAPSKLGEVIAVLRAFGNAKVFEVHKSSDQDHPAVAKMQRTVVDFNVALELVAGSGAGVGTSVGAWAAVSFLGVASTGTAIGGLSGAAASDAARVVVTIQPPGAVFTSPAPVTFPNVEGLKPHEVTEFFSYDHDLNSFVSIGTATVSDDASILQSDPGTGVPKAGWHLSSTPAPPTCAGTCPQCLMCRGHACLLDIGAGACNDHNVCTENDHCDAGVCTGDPFHEDTPRLTNQFDATFPPALLNKVNNVLSYIPGLQGAHFDTIRCGGSTKIRDCCGQSTGIVRQGFTEKAGRFQLELNLSDGLPIWGVPRIHHRVDIPGIVSIDLSFESVVSMGAGRFQFNADIGLRNSRCQPEESCGFGEVNTVQTFDVFRAKAESSLCTTFGSADSCTGALVQIVPGRVTIGFGVAYNKPSCSIGITGSAYLGTVTARAEAIFVALGVQYRRTLIYEIFPGVAGL